MRAAILAALAVASLGACAPGEDPGARDARFRFMASCDDAVRGQLSQPATFVGSGFGGTEARVVDGHWSYGHPFTASNGFGAVGHYWAACFSADDGTTVAAITVQ